MLNLLVLKYSECGQLLVICDLGPLAVMLECIWSAGVLAVIAVGVILVATAAVFGVRSLFQIRDQMAKAKAGYSTVELSDPHQNMETGMLPEDSSPRHSPMAGSPRRGGREDAKQH